MTIGEVPKTTGVIKNQKYAAFKQWFAFKNSQSDILKIEVWDEENSLIGDLMGECQIPLHKPVSEETCTFHNGQVSFIYVCT